MSIPSIPTFPAVPGGVRMPSIKIPSIPKIPTIPAIPSGVKALDGLKGAYPGLAGGGNLCGINIVQLDVYATAEVIKAALLGRIATVSILGTTGASLLEKLNKLRAIYADVVSFQAELAGLNWQDPYAVDRFLHRWEGKVPGGAGQYVKALSSALDKGLAFDLCKLVPNVTIDPNTGVAKIMAKMAPTPNKAPAAVEPLKVTVVDNTTKPSPGASAAVIPSTGQAVSIPGGAPTFQQKASYANTVSPKISDIIKRVKADPANKYFLETSKGRMDYGASVVNIVENLYGKILAGIKVEENKKTLADVESEVEVAGGADHHLDFMKSYIAETKALLDANKAMVVDEVKYNQMRIDFDQKEREAYFKKYGKPRPNVWW